MIEINVNDTVSVELTEAGVKIYNESFYKLLLPTPINRDENRFYQAGDKLVLPFWDMMQIFGNAFFNGNLANNLPFKENKITIISK